ncbi:hypothetical protein [Bifidobacterium sp. A11]|uniref:hypothetical protein n=1 Tax=Bifidobacterium sp. A11 TaxID=1394176 RepID=UPI001C119ED9|nr:hypothetical protein [Bifidobacterium sp. A11]
MDPGTAGLGAWATGGDSEPATRSEPSRSLGTAAAGTIPTCTVYCCFTAPSRVFRLYGRWKKSLKADDFDCSLQGFSMLPLTSTIAMSDRISRYVNKADARHAAAEMLNDQGKLGRGESVRFFELLAYLCLDERLARFWFPLRKGEDASWDESGLHVVNKATGEITWSSAMGSDQQYWRVLHSIEKVMKGRRVLNYSHRCRREDSVLDSLWNRFLDHAHAAGSSGEDITRDDVGKGKLVQVISAETWQSEFVNDPSRIISLLKP